jgi:amino acid adenylation domain-containing protein
MTLHRLVIDAARKYPDAVAVSDPVHTLTYDALDRQADLLAARYRESGIAKGDRIVIWVEKSALAVVAMQAALRTGAVYVPVDGGNPPARVARILADSGAAVLVTNSDRTTDEVTGDTGPAVITLDDLLTGPAAEPVDEPAEETDLAYILYTSGSTGDPKGVSVSHRNALAFVEWAVETLDARADDVFSNHAPLNFDLSVLDLYGAFSVGAAVKMIPSGMSYSPKLLVDWLHREQISIWYSVPSALVLMIREGGLLDAEPPGSLRAILFAGEPFAMPYVRRLRAWTGARLLNLYGPTETNVCTFHEVRDEDLERDRPVPIGIPCSGDRVWAQDSSGRVVDTGEEGELFVDGPTVMLGYFGKEPQTGPYGTGDIVTRNPDGTYDYVARRDHMVKVRGHRIELGDIESALLRHPGIAEAAVIVAGSGMAARIEAFIVPSGDTTPGLIALKRQCAEHLPPYMTVDGVHAVASLPRTANGKTNRRLLEEIATPRDTAASGSEERNAPKEVGSR